VTLALSLRVGRLLELRRIARQANGELGVTNFHILEVVFRKQMKTRDVDPQFQCLFTEETHEHE
jgi:hypothetical protein